ncbi:MAG: hypothetical protein ACP5U1_03720 [Desulfomonilaceae bacterium]
MCDRFGLQEVVSDFSISFVANNGRSHGIHADWVAYRGCYRSVCSTEYVGTIIGRADAVPLGVLVQHEKAKNFFSGQWVKVEGKVKITTKRDQRKTEILAEKVEPIDPPKDQYLYP